MWFGEDQGRYVVSVAAAHADALLANLRGQGLPVRRLGTVGGDAIVVTGEPPLPLAQLKTKHEAWLPGFMGG